MSNNLLLNWAALAVSLFNSILLIWLGLTVLFNSDRRAWGVWLASGGLLLGGSFFISHTAILERGLLSYSSGLIFWWAVGMIPAILLPFGWYLVILWYAGYAENRADLPPRQKIGFVLIVGMIIAGLAALAIGIILLLDPIYNNPIAFALRSAIRWSVAGIPLLGFGYSFYVVLSLSLALDAVLRPGPSRRAMGHLARQRARPWLIAATVGQFIVSLLVAGAVLYIVQRTRDHLFYTFYQDMVNGLAIVDLLIASLLGGIIVLVGQSVVAYEIFTGKSLPRRGLVRHWRRAIIIATGYGVLIGGALAINLRPVYGLLLTAMLMTLFYALFSWRSYEERERYIDNLRPFVASPRVYDQLLTEQPAGSPTTYSEATTPFHALCREVLEATWAALTPVGPLAPLVGSLWVYPSDWPVSLSMVEKLTGRFPTPQSPPLPLDPNHHGAAQWAVPLWSERGLIGILLLGPKLGGGLYTQEEIDIARASGERLIDTQASAEMARRLMSLQRQQLAESQIIDRRARRTLHDDILPQMHAAMIQLSSIGMNGATQNALDLLTSVHRQISDLLRDMPTGAAPEVSRLGLLPALQKAVNDEFATAFDAITWDIPSSANAQLSLVPPLTAEVLFYAAREAVRNAAKYGRANDQPLQLQISVTLTEQLQVVIEDNGVGLVNGHGGEGKPAGSGHGLALHSTMMAVVGGELATASIPGQFTRVTLTLPLP